MTAQEFIAEMWSGAIQDLNAINHERSHNGV